MGLDLIVEGCAKPGHEDEWRRILKRSFGDEKVSEDEIARFRQISIPGHERIGAPRVGTDNAADQWIVDKRNAKTPEEVAAVLKEFHGYYVLRLVECDGVPKYSHGGLYDGADDTSFRGAFLSGCQGVLTNGLLNEAWNHKFPEEAVAYGRALLVAADAAENGTKAPVKRTLLSRLGFSKESGPVDIGIDMDIEEQLEVVRAAGRWFVFWGERGHAIRAWF